MQSLREYCPQVHRFLSAAPSCGNDLIALQQGVPAQSMRKLPGHISMPFLCMPIHGLLACLYTTALYVSAAAQEAVTSSQTPGVETEASSAQIAIKSAQIDANLRVTEQARMALEQVRATWAQTKATLSSRWGRKQPQARS